MYGVVLWREEHRKHLSSQNVEDMKYSIDEKNSRVATKTCWEWCTIIGNTPLPQNKVTSWNIKILKSWRNDGKDIYIGVVPFDIYQNEEDGNSEKCGWYFNCCDSALYSGPPHYYKGKKHGPRKEKGDMYTQETVWVL